MATVNLGRVGIVPKGAWNSATQYVKLDLVSNDGNSWLAKRDNKNVTPNTTNTNDWQLISNNADLVATVQGYKNDAEAAATTAENYASIVVSAVAPVEESSTASQTYNSGDYFLYNGVLHIATDTIAQGGTITPGTNCTAIPDGLGVEVASINTEMVTVDERLTVLEAGAWQEAYDITTFNRMVVMGLGPKVGPVGTTIITEKETGVSATIGSIGGGTPGITGATVNETTFINKLGHSDAGEYEFIYDGAAWRLNGVAVTLSQYGIAKTGTAAVDDVIVVHVTANNIVMNVMDHDYHTPANSAIPHTCTVGMRDCFGDMQFDAPEALIKVVDGLAAESHFYLTLDHGASGGGTGQDGTYGGTLGNDQAIPAGGYLRHTTIGATQSGGYNASQITGGKWIAYDTSFNQIGEQIDTDSGDTTGTNFGTATASTYQGNSEHVNFTTRNAGGNNRIDQSAWFQYANAEGTGWWVQKNEWDFPPESVSTIKGFLTGLDPAMKAAMVKVKIRVALPNCDGGGYADIETYVFPLSMTEVGFGQNNSQYETSFGLNNTLKTTALSFFQGVGNADRIKTFNGAANPWFLRSPLASTTTTVRRVFTDGDSKTIGAYNKLTGFVAAWAIGNPVIQSA